MKIAILFHGIAGGMDGKNGYGNPSNLYHCAKFWENNVYGDADYDIFIHSWSTEAQESIVGAFKPTRYAIEPQPTFGFDIPEETKYHDNNVTMLYKNISRFTSAYIVYNIMLQYQKETGIEYDYCILSRMDLLFFNKINLNSLEKDNVYLCNNPFPNWQNPNESNIIFDPFLIMDYQMTCQFCNIIVDLNNFKYRNIAGNSHYLCTAKLRDMGYIHKIKYICTRFSDLDVYRFIFMDNANDGRSEEYNAGANAKRMFDILKAWELEENTKKVLDNPNNYLILNRKSIFS